MSHLIAFAFPTSPGGLLDHLCMELLPYKTRALTAHNFGGDTVFGPEAAPQFQHLHSFSPHFIFPVFMPLVKKDGEREAPLDM